MVQFNAEIVSFTCQKIRFFWFRIHICVQMPKDFQLSPFPNLFEKLVFKSRHRPFNLGPERQKRKKIIQQRFKFRSTQKSAFLSAVQTAPPPNLSRHRRKMRSLYCQ